MVMQKSEPKRHSLCNVPTEIVFDLSDEQLAMLVLDYTTFVPDAGKNHGGLVGLVSRLIQQVEAHGNCVEEDYKPQRDDRYGIDILWSHFWIKEVKPEEEDWLTVRKRTFMFQYSPNRRVCYLN